MTDWLEEILKAEQGEAQLWERLLRPLAAAVRTGEAEPDLPGMDSVTPSGEPEFLPGGDPYPTTAAESGLHILYRRAGEAVARVSPPAPQAERVVVRESAPAGAGLTVEGLDRTLRRDSRRYDGAMSIY